MSQDLDVAPPTDPAERLQQLWRQGRRPDVDAFLAALGPLKPEQLAAVLRADQRQRWEAGDHVRVETYLQQHSLIRGRPDAAVDLIYAEYLLREQQSE